MGKGKLTITSADEQFKVKKIKKKNKHIIFENNVDPQPPQSEVIEEQFLQQKTTAKGILAHLAICFPDSILQIPQTSHLRAYFISEIARISSIFKVDEIIILKDHGYIPKSQKFNPCEYIARNLQYLETPQYLRKSLFKMHPDLNNVGVMNPIEALHHLKSDQVSQFRQGVALQRPTRSGAGSWVDVGLRQQAKMDILVLPLTRVTLRLKNYDDPYAPFYEAEAVSKKTPRTQKGLYWGYDVRIAQNLKQMVEGGAYDYTMLCNHSKQSYNLPQIESFQSISLKDKSILLFFSGAEDLSALLQKDGKSKWSLEESLKRFSYSLKQTNLGVKQLRLQQQLFLTLSKIIDYTI